MSVELSLVIIVAFTFLGIISGTPIGFIFGACCLIFLLISGNLDGITWIVPATIKFMQGYAFLAVPLYMILGVLLQESGLADKLFIFVHSLLGRARGAFGSALVTFVSIFGAMSGSAASAIAAIGSLVIPEGPKYGYRTEHITGLVACSSLIAMLIPPSITMIIFGVSSKIGIAVLFLATAIPGVLTALFFIVVNLVLIRRWGLTPAEQQKAIQSFTAQSTTSTSQQRFRKGIGAWPSLMIPV
ncbi:MAG: TRAP transporter large permease subunit, partial [Chloroflexota bacterium]